MELEAEAAGSQLTAWIATTGGQLTAWIATAGGQLPAGIAGEKEKTNQGGWFYFTLVGPNPKARPPALSFFRYLRGVCATLVGLSEIPHQRPTKTAQKTH